MLMVRYNRADKSVCYCCALIAFGTQVEVLTLEAAKCIAYWYLLMALVFVVKYNLNIKITIIMDTTTTQFIFFLCETLKSKRMLVSVLVKE